MEDTLLHFYKATLSDPLFAAEGMDLEQGVAALDRIEEQCKEMERIAGVGSWMRKLFVARYPIAKHAFPLTFLRSFIESERQRRIFLAAPTMEAAKRLLSNWKKTQQVYADDVRRYRFLHETIVDVEKTPDTFQFEDFVMNVTSLVDVEKMLVLFQNVEALRAEVSRREELLLAGTPYSTVRYIKTLPAYKPAVVIPRHQYLIDLDLQHGFPFRHNTVVETFGPFAYTLSHFDSAPTEHVFYAHIVQEAGSQAKLIKISLADQFYFIDLSNLDERNRGLQAPVIERGLSHWFQNVTHLYSTRDQLYVADMATAIDLHKRPWLNASQLSLQRSSMLDLMLMGGSFDFGIYIENMKARLHSGLSNEYSFLDGLLLRTHPSLYYLPFNSSVWRLEELPNFLGSKKEGAPKYKTLEMIEEKLPEGMIELIMQGGRIREEGRQKAQKAQL